MRGKTGAARIALATGCPVIPMAHWGAAPRPGAVRQEAARPAAPDGVGDDRATGRPQRPHGRESRPARSSRRRPTRIMDAITALVAELRDEVPPADRLDPREAGLPGDRQGRRPLRRPRPEILMTRAAVMGSGSWGTAYAMVLADAGTDVVLWGKDAEVVASGQRRPREPQVPPRDRAAVDAPGHHRRGRGARRRGRRRARRPVAGAAGQPRGLAPAPRRPRRPRQPHEGHRARHDHADERGDRRGRRRPGRAGGRRLRARTWLARSPSGSPPPPWWPAPMPTTPGCCRTAR